MAQIVFRRGVTVTDIKGNTATFPATDFEVLPSGALQLKHVRRETFAPGQWLCVQFALETEGDSK